MEVSPISDSDLRIRLLTAIRDAGFKVGDKGFREESKFTRIYTLTKAIRIADDGEPDDDNEYIAGLVESMWEKSWKDTQAIVDVLQKFKW